MSTNQTSPNRVECELAELEKLHLSERGESTAGAGPLDEDELDRFRNQWKTEVQAKRQREASAWRVTQNEGDLPQQADASRPGDNPSETSTASLQVSPAKASRPLAVELDEPPEAGPSRRHPATGPIKRPAKPAVRSTNGKEDAVQLYGKAVEKEQSGQLSEALMLYRKAFKLDDSVDRLYTRSLATAAHDYAHQEPSEQPTASSADVVSASAPADEPYSFQRHIQLQPDYEKTAPLQFSSEINARPSPLTTLLISLPIVPSDTEFLPADEDLPLPIAHLPAELLDPIFVNLDVTNIERFATTCWRARYLTAVSDVWKRIALSIYRGPSMVPDGWDAKDMVRKHRGEWRTTVVEEERIRMDGCYISVCHYVRPGAGDQWVTVTHMSESPLQIVSWVSELIVSAVTYHRFLRFYPDGSVISFLTTEHPSEVVPVLRRSLRGKGLHFGRWQLLRSDQELKHPPSARHEKRRARIIVTELLDPGAQKPKYEFEMELTLRETGRGRWNKLDISSYSSINLATGESLGLSLKHQKPFYFSKVKSYNPPF